jgi:hypothetical protein
MLGFADLPQFPAQPMLIAAVTAFLASVFVIWKLVGAVMKLMFFIIAFGLGYGVAYLIGQLGGHPQAQWVYAGEGLAFAWVINLVRAKVARAIATFIILGVGQVTSWFGFAPKTAQIEKPAIQKPTHAAQLHDHKS